MKRFHVRVAVPDFDAGVHFYSALFAAELPVREDAGAASHAVLQLKYDRA